MLEPEAPRRWHDECLQAHCDLSTVSWILTANDLTPISRPLLSRASVCRVGLPGPKAIEGILDTMRGDIARELGLKLDRLPVRRLCFASVSANWVGNALSYRS